MSGPHQRAPVARTCGRHVPRRFLGAMLGAALTACALQSTPVTPQAAKDSAAGGPSTPRVVSTRDSMLEQRVARLDLQLAERDAQFEDLQA